MWVRGCGAVRRCTWLPLTRCWHLAGCFLLRGYGRQSLALVVAAVAISEVLTTGEPLVGRLLAATIAAALAMLGPGQLSVDARLFGWRRIDTPLRKKQFDVR